MENPNYAMFTEKGNQMVHGIVMTKTTWEEAESELYSLAKDKDFEEATDTAVREAVYVVYYPEVLKKAL